MACYLGKVTNLLKTDECSANPSVVAHRNAGSSENCSPVLPRIDLLRRMRQCVPVLRQPLPFKAEEACKLAVCLSDGV